MRNANAKIWQARGAAAGFHPHFLYSKTQLTQSSVLLFAGQIKMWFSHTNNLLSPEEMVLGTTFCPFYCQQYFKLRIFGGGGKNLLLPGACPLLKCPFRRLLPQCLKQDLGVNCWFMAIRQEDEAKYSHGVLGLRAAWEVGLSCESTGSW